MLHSSQRSLFDVATHHTLPLRACFTLPSMLVSQKAATASSADARGHTSLLLPINSALQIHTTIKGIFHQPTHRAQQLKTCASTTRYHTYLLYTLIVWPL